MANSPTVLRTDGPSANRSASALLEQTEGEPPRRTELASSQSLAFAHVVSLLACSPAHKFFTLADLEWLVIPPLMAGQVAVAEIEQQNGTRVPVAAVLWASVSTDVDKRLTENLEAPIRLKPDEWLAGDILWLVDVIGDQHAIPNLLGQLTKTAFRERKPKVRIQGKDGNASVGTLDVFWTPKANG